MNGFEPSRLQEIRDLYERGLCLQAYRLAEKLGSFKECTDVDAIQILGRLAPNLGATRLGQLLHLRAYRRRPNHPEARYYYARVVLERRGPLASWDLMSKLGEPVGAPQELMADWYSYHAYVAGCLRDFETAEKWINRAMKTAPENPWTWVERSSLYEMQDRYEEALAAAQKTQQLKPWFRPGVQAVAHAFSLLSRRDEAIELLLEADRRLESAPCVGQLLLLQSENEMWEDCRRSLERYVELSPLMEKETQQWLDGIHSDVLYHLGDVAGSIHFARKVDLPYFSSLAANMESSAPDAGRVSLPVGFVRQHYMTCVPATLTSISRYFEMPADHLEVSEEICYDGTPDHSERNWARENGWAPREFRVTWESAVKLLDRGIPFTLTTIYPGNAHLQAVIGYDARRGTLLIRDPFYSHISEGLASELAEKFRSSGPRGMALAPKDKWPEAGSIDLPDAELYDHYFQLQRELNAHNEARALLEYDRLKQVAPDHRITLWAARVLAMYNQNHSEMLACLEALLEQFPDDGILQLSRISALRELGRRKERLDLLAQLSEQALTSREDRPDAAPIYWQQYAQELAEDAREHDKAILFLKRAIRARPVDAGNFYVLANIYWSRREFERALPLYRFAACLEDKEEHLAKGYFSAARYLKKTDEALSFLRERNERLGGKSSQPTRSLYWALDELDRTPEGLEILEKGLEKRPADGELLHFAAQERARLGQYDAANALLDSAVGKTSRLDALTASARILTRQGRQADALRAWQEVITIEPLSLDAHRAAARILAEMEGPQAAISHFQRAADEYPHHFGLRQAWTEWLRAEDDFDTEERVLHGMIDLNPVDAWTRRELALALARLRRFDDASEQARQAVSLEPTNSYSYSTLGEVFQLAGKTTEAVSAFREAIRLSIDNEYAVSQLISLSESNAAKRGALKIVEEELLQQTIYGDGLLSYYQYAGSILEPQQVRAFLQSALDARPDLWHSWSALVHQLMDMDLWEDALKIAVEAADRFPLIPGCWVDLSAVQRAMGQIGQERDSLQQALLINPGWGFAARQLSESFERDRNFDKCTEILEAAILRDPLDAHNHASYAWVLWNLRRTDNAVEALKRTIGLDPANDWAWRTMPEWAEELDKPALPIEMARDLVTRRPGEANSWVILARVLPAEALEERLSALSKAVGLSPRMAEAYDLRAELLASAGRFDDALDVCRISIGGVRPPMLQARAAEIEAYRGNIQTAMERMRALLRVEPDYAAGWAALANWCDNAKNYKEYVDCARRLTTLCPSEARGFGYLGDALMKLGSRSEAKAALKRALDMLPSYGFAGASLFSAQVHDKEWEGAAETVERVKTGVGGAYPLTMELELALTRFQIDTATRVFKQICLGDERDAADALATATELMKDFKKTDEARQVYLEVIEDPSAQPIVGSYWVKACVFAKDWSFEQRLPDLLEKGDIGFRAAAAYIEEIAGARNWKKLMKYLSDNRRILQSHLSTWGLGAYALIEMKNYPGTIDWTNHWRGRNDLESWALLNRAVALRHLRNTEEANAVSLHALTLKRDHCSTRHSIWLALDAAMAGDVELSRNQLSSVDREGLPAFYVFTIDMIHALCSSVSKHAAAFRDARNHVAVARKNSPLFHQNALQRMIYFLVIRQVARNIGGPIAQIWRISAALKAF